MVEPVPVIEMDLAMPMLEDAEVCVWNPPATVMRQVNERRQLFGLWIEATNLTKIIIKS